MEPNYFTCTLGQAATLGIQQPHGTVNDLVDAQAKNRPDDPAVGFLVPSSLSREEWTHIVFSFGDIKRGSEHVASLLRHEHGRDLFERQTVGLLCPGTQEFLFVWLGADAPGSCGLARCSSVSTSSYCEFVQGL